MAHQPTHWPDQHDDPPAGVTIHPLHQLPDQLPEPTIPGLPTIPGGQRGNSHGTPGASALAHYQCHRAADWARFLRTLPLRLAGVVAAGGLAGTLANGAGPRVAGPAAAVAAGGLGWLLRFRVTSETAAWRRGARCERELPAAGALRAMFPFVNAEWDDWERLGRHGSPVGVAPPAELAAEESQLGNSSFLEPMVDGVAEAKSLALRAEASDIGAGRWKRSIRR